MPKIFVRHRPRAASLVWFAVMRAAFVIAVMCASLGFAAEPVTRFYLVGIADPDELLERAKETGSPDGKVWLNPQRTLLNVTDTAERQAQIAALVQSLQRPPRNIALKVRYPDFVTLPGAGPTASVGGGDRTGLTGMSGNPLGGSKIRFGGAPPPVVTPGQPSGRQPPQPPENAMTINVAAGKNAWLMVSPGSPNAAWIFQWGVERAYWQPTPTWQRAKAYLLVEPKLRGDKIRLRLLPVVTGIVGATERHVAVEATAAERTVASGEELEVSADLREGDEFYRNFFMTFDRAWKPVPIQLWITPTVQ
ncbi:MAG: hypothetical protein FJ388_08050 [Verrucomicrobia bacterium]|nr:hypothetical protein [Verrucomicrobiota bacterium]